MRAARIASPRALVSMLISDNSLSVILQIIFSLANYLKEC